MRLFKKRELKNYLISAKKDERIYFCPYCKALCFYDEDQNSPRHFHFNHVTKKYRCLNCSEGFENPFDDSTYAETTTKYSHVPFHLNGLFSDDIVNPFIANAISSLRDEGFSNRSIHEITHFPRTMINEVVSKQWDDLGEYISIEEFFEEHLNFSPELLARLKVKGREKFDVSFKEECVTKALMYGCSFEDIRQFLPIRKIEITNISKRLYGNPKAMNEISINKVNRKIEIKKVVKVTAIKK